MRKPSKIIFTLSLAMSIFMSVTLPINSAQTTILHLAAKSNYPNVEQSFIVNASIADVLDLHFWQLLITYDPELLTCLDLWVPEDNIFGSLAELAPPEIDNSIGYVKAGCWIDSPTGVSGSGTLCQMEFKCKGPGISPIIIAVDETNPPMGTYLADPDGNLISFGAVSDIAEIQALGFTENIFYVTQDSVAYPILVFSNSTLTSFSFSQTDKEMTFDVSGTSGTFGSSSVVISKALLNGTFAVLVNEDAIYFSLFENTTHNFLRFRYKHSSKTIRIRLTIRADVNGDRKVNMKDIYIVIMAFGSKSGDPNWNPLADIAPVGDLDKKVNMKDVYLAILNFGKVWS